MRTQADRRRAAIVAFLAVMGPGIITGFAGNDAGGVTTYTAVGAHYGFEMLWLLLLSTAGLLVIQEMCARMGAVTGKGLSDLIRERFGVRWTIVAMLALLGTTITPYMQFYIQASVVDKGIDKEQYRFERVDVLLGAILTGLNAFFIVVVAGAVLHPAASMSIRPPTPHVRFFRSPASRP